MALALDASTPALVAVLNAGAPAVTASFTPPMDDTVLEVVVMSNGASGANPGIILTNSGAALPWTEKVRRAGSEGGAQPGAVVIYTAAMDSSRSLTVSVDNDQAGDFGAIALQVFVWTGADTANPVGNVGEGSSTTNAITPNALTTSVPESWVNGGGTEWNGLGNPTSTDVEAPFNVGSGILSGCAVRKAAATPDASTVVTLNFDAAGTGAASWNWAAVEILPASAPAEPVVGAQPSYGMWPGAGPNPALRFRVDPQSTDVIAAAIETELSEATYVFEAQALTATPGVVTVTLTEATYTIAAQELTATPIPVNVDLTPAAYVLAAQELTATPGVVTAALTAATYTVTAQTLTATPGPVTQALTPGTLTLEAQALTATPGVVTVSLTAATWTIAAQELGVAGAVTLTPADYTIAAQAVTATPGVVTQALTPATWTTQAQELTATPDPVNVDLTAGPYSLTAQALTATPGPVATALTAATFTIAAQELEFAGAVVTRPNTGAVSRPSTGTTTRPSTGATTRPGTGTITRPYTGIIDRP